MMKIGTWIQVIDSNFPEYYGDIGVVIEVFTHTVTAEFEGDREMILLKRQVRDVAEMEMSESIRPFDYDPYDDPEFKKYQLPDTAGNVPKDVNLNNFKKEMEDSLTNIDNTIGINVAKLEEDKKKAKTLANKNNSKQLYEYFLNTYGENGASEFATTKYKYPKGQQKLNSKEERVIATIDELLRLEMAQRERAFEIQDTLNFMNTTKFPFESAFAVYKIYLNSVKELADFVKIDDEGNIEYLIGKEELQDHLWAMNWLEKILVSYWDGYIPSKKAQDQKKDAEWALKQK